jgi:hypothetical protein
MSPGISLLGVSSLSFYHDDPVDESRARNSIFSSALALVLLLAGGIFFLQSTLAANISLNSGGTIEFGQAVSQAVACSGGQNVTVTPKSSFVNAANGTGTYYLGSITVSDIPNSCYGADFKLSAFGTSSSTALAIFNSTSTEAVVYDNAGTFQLGVGGTGTTLTPGTGTFTVSFTSPVALSSSVDKVTIQSGTHTLLCSEGGDCSVGETGPGGGIVFYRDVNGFTCGATLSSSCRYLEAAPYNWSGQGHLVTPYAVSAYRSTSVPTYNGFNATGTAIGTGLANTRAIVNQNGLYNASSNRYAAGAVVLYNGGGKSDWFLPSKDELTQVNVQRSLLLAANIVTNDYYYASTEVDASNGMLTTMNGASTGNGAFTKAGGGTSYVLAIRAF